MAKKGLLIVVLAVLVSAGLFAQGTVHKHQQFDMLLGLNFGLGITPNIGDLFSISSGNIPKGNYALTFDVGLTYDFYLFSFLSFTTGLLVHPDIYLDLDRELTNINSFRDIVTSPLCLTIPVAVHFNVPKVEWLYAGVG
jgi:hypothetical protein